jgi:hypothetical protein
MRTKAASRDKRLFSHAAPPFHLILTPQRLADRPACLKIDEAYRTPAGRISSAAAVVVHVLALLRIARVPGVERAVGAADDVDEMHEEILSSTR